MAGLPGCYFCSCQLVHVEVVLVLKSADVQLPGLSFVSKQNKQQKIERQNHRNLCN